MTSTKMPFSQKDTVRMCFCNTKTAQMMKKCSKKLDRLLA